MTTVVAHVIGLLSFDSGLLGHLGERIVGTGHRDSLVPHPHGLIARRSLLALLDLEEAAVELSTGGIAGQTSAGDTQNPRLEGTTPAKGPAQANFSLTNASAAHGA